MPTIINVTSFVDQQALVFVDSSVRDYSALVASISPDAEIIVFDGSRDGVEQISAALAGQSGVSAVHILSHGADGELDLGTTSLTADSLPAYADAIAGWSLALAPGADILLYGCNVAQSHIGQQFVQQIARLTSANVAASTDTTGAAALGGNWTLEYATGSILAHPVIPADVAYDGVLSIERFATLSWAVDLTDPGGPGTVTVDFHLEAGFRADYPWASQNFVVGGNGTETVANGGIHIGTILEGPGGVDNLSFGDGTYFGGTTTSQRPYFLVTQIPADPTLNVIYAELVTATGQPVTHTYASTTANYVVEWDGTTRQSISNDAFHDQPWRTQTIVDIAPGVTKSPRVVSNPLIFVLDNAVNQIFLPTVTFDNDIGVWRLGTAAEFIGSEPGFPLQFPPGSAVAPPGLTLNSNGLATWDILDADNPTVAPGQFYTMTAMFEAHNPSTGAFVSETPVDFLIQVVANIPNPPPVFDVIPPLHNTVVFGTPQDFVIHASDPGAFEVDINSSPLPAGMTAVAHPGELDIHFDPTAGEIGQDYVVSFQATSFADANHNGIQTSAVSIEFTVQGNTPPVVQTNAGATDLEGGTITIGTTALNVTDAQQDASLLTYSLAALPTHGQLLLNGVALTTSDTFTQSNINANQITYHHDGSETTSDAFLFNVSDGAGGSTGQTNFAITVSPVDTVALAFTSAASISGTAQEGQVLTAVNGTLNDSDAQVTGYQWISSNGNAVLGTGATYTVKESDEGTTITLVETATDSDGGPSTTSTSTATGPVSDITLAFTSAASINGTAQEGQVLTAVNGTLNDSDAQVTGYQWVSSNGNAVLGTGATYTLKESDEGTTITLVETATNSEGGSTTSTSAATGPVSDITLAFTSAASINGTAQEGQVLTAVNGTLNDSDAQVTGYQWISSNGNAVLGTGATYTVKESDEGTTITLVETATDSDGGSTTSTSVPTAAVSDITLAFTTPAAISGTAQEGQVLTAVNGTLNDSDAQVTGYQWISSNGNAVLGTGATYTLKESDEGATITLVETATDSEGGSTTSTSAATGPVSDITLAFTSAASISGTAQEGQVLTAVNGTLNDSDAQVTGYQWVSSNGNTLLGTSSTYTLKESDEGTTITLVETATDSEGGSTTSTSAATGPVSDITLAFTSAASINGTAQEGQVLTAVNGTLNDSDAQVTGYQWISSNGNAVLGTGATYTVKESDEGTTITLVETAADSDGGSTTSTSVPTAAVSDITLAFTTPAAISGTAQEGQVLTAVNGTLNDSDAQVTGYQWISSNGNAVLGTGATYTVKESDEGTTITLVETATDSDGGSTTSTSAATGPVSDITLAFTTPAAISGTAQEGQVLTAVNGTLNDSDAQVTGYQWISSNGNAVLGTGATYTVKESDEGTTITLVETATDSDGGSTTSTSAATGPVSDITLAFTSAASISGTAQEGQVLTAVNGTLNDSDAQVTGYQWISSNGNAVLGTGATYTVKESDEGTTITLVETATDSDGGSTTSTSVPTAAVSDITLAFTSAASISGTAQEGQVLTAVNGTLNDSDAQVTGYQWVSSNGNTLLGTSSTYTLKESDEGTTITLVETATDSDGGSTTSTSVPTAAVSDITLAFTSAASISGTAQEGQVLTAVNGTLNDSDAQVTGYQWISSNGNAVLGTGATYTLKESDEGTTITLVETATDSEGGSTTSTSAATGPVSDITLAFTSAASISGTAQEGQVLTAVNGTLNDSDAQVTGYQWVSSNGNTLLGTSSTYTLKESDEGTTITLVETATDSEGGSTTSTSAATGPVSDITLAFTSAASISGTAQEGQVLTAVNGTLNDSDAQVTGYQWVSSNGNTLLGTSSTYTLKESDEGTTITLVETATDSEGGSTTSTSAATGPVSDITLAFTSAASINGTAQEGQVLTAVNGTLNDSDAQVTGYQWISSNGNAVLGTGATYTLKESDEGATITLVETATDSEGGSTTSTSAATGPVSDITLAFTSAASISGTAQEGQVLTAVNGTLNDSDAQVTGYQWVSSNGNTLLGTSSTYTLKESDEGTTITLVETATDSEGGSTTSTSAATGPVSDITLAFTSAASISGTAQEGQVLTAVNGTLNDSDAQVTGYQWVSSNGNTLLGTSSTYTLKESDEGTTITLVETATDSDGGPSTTSTSAATGPVSDITLAFTSAASINGTAQEGRVLTAINGTLNDSDAQVTGYQWVSSNGNAVLGTGATYTLKESDEGTTITLVETATDSDGGPSTTSTSAATGPVSDITLAFTSAASINGTAQEGQVLTAVNGTLNDSDAQVTGYQWVSSNGNAVLGTGATYTLKESDEGTTITLVETATDSDGGSTTSTSVPTAAVSDITLAFTSAASISGTAQEGQVLTAVNGTLNDSDAQVTGYQWVSSNGNTLLGTSSTYTLKESDEGTTITLVETATDSEGGSTTSTSAATGPVSDITLAFTSAASINGTAQEGRVLTAINGTLNDSDAQVTGYQWISSNGNALLGTGSTYTLKESDEGATITLVETATDSEGGSTTSTSAATGPVSDITLAFTSAASISGTAQEGQVLTAVNGTLNDSDAQVTGYQWVSSNGNTLLGTSSTYTLKESDEGTTITLVETATDSEGGSTTSTSAATGPVSDITLAFTSAASISGTAQEGQVLTAVNGTLNDSDAQVTGYQWVSSNGNTLLGTSSTYTLKESDEGTTITLVETATDSEGGSTTSTSAATGPVSDITLAFTSAASISGTAQEGQVLTAVNGTLNDSDAQVTGYQWVSSNGNTLLGTSSTYTLKESDEGTTITLVETATDSDGGPSTTSTSAATGPVSDITLAFTSAASINGTAQEGRVLTAINGTLNDSDAQVTGYQWVSSNGNAVLGTGATYTLKESDEGTTITLVETATDSDGGPSTTSTSAATGPVSDITLAFTSAASINGTAQEGQVLTAVNGTLNDSDAQVTGYQWVSSNGNTLLGTSSTYTLKESDEGTTITLVETATDSEGGSTTSTSAATGPVSDITLAFTSAASISGTAQEGQVLTAVNGTLNDSDAQVTGYQWVSSNGNTLLGTSSTYTLKESDEGTTITLVETATDSDGGPSTTSTSAAVGPVSDITLAFTSAASINGTAQEGQVLTAVNGTLNDSDAQVTGYQWISSNGNAVLGTGATYTLKESDEGTTITLVETATDSEGGSTTSTSAATGPVSDITLVTPTVTVTTSNGVLNLAHATATVMFTFSAAPSAFTLADTSASGGMLGNLARVDATHYTAAFTAASNTDGSGSVSVIAGSWQDGNGNPGAGGSTGFVVDTVAPIVPEADASVATKGKLTADVAHGVLAGASEPAASLPLTVSAVNGSAGYLGQMLAGSYGKLILNADGSYSYTVSASAGSLPYGAALDNFSFSVADRYGNTTAGVLSVLVYSTGENFQAGTPGGTVQAGNGSNVLDGIAGNETLSAGNGTNFVLGGANDVISVGNGSNDIIGGAHDSITAGNGTNVLTGGANDTIRAGNGSNRVTGGANDTITLGNGNNIVIGGPNDIISVGNGSNQLVAAPGDVWTIGTGANVFEFAPGFGNNTINGFQKGKDVLNFDPALIANYMAAMPDIKQMGANTVITVDANDSVTLTGVNAAQLTAQNFSFNH